MIDKNGTYTLEPVYMFAFEPILQFGIKDIITDAQLLDLSVFSFDGVYTLSLSSGAYGDNKSEYFVPSFYGGGDEYIQKLR
ncbi:MAG: hypothetical protein R2883_06410 [Caldisericia bacterium]